MYSVKYSAKYSVKPWHRTAVAILGSSACLAACMVAVAASAGTVGAVVVAEKREPAAVADIGTITDLARQIQVEELRKKLRELRTAPTKSAGGSDSGLRLSDPIAAPLAKKVSTAAAAAAQSSPPQVVSIIGIGSRLSARLADGRNVGPGDRIGHAGGEWEVSTVSNNSVTFKRCEVNKDMGKDGSKCSTVQTHVGS